MRLAHMTSSTGESSPSRSACANPTGASSNVPPNRWGKLLLAVCLRAPSPAVHGSKSGSWRAVCRKSFRVQ